MLLKSQHRERNDEYNKEQKRGRPKHRSENAQSKRDYRKNAREREIEYIGVDGEGKGRAEHKYVLLAAATDDREWYVSNPEGLSTVTCLDFLLHLPNRRSKLFAFSFNYDLTMMLRDLPNELLYKLFRPELRQRLGNDALKGPIAVRWNGYRLNLQGTKFTVTKYNRRAIVWDLFKFFQSKFTSALKDWKVGDPAVLKNMEHMKDQRKDFDKLGDKEILAYCFDECRYMAELARRLVTAHVQVGLKLTNYYGAGSSGQAMLKAMGIQKEIKDCPDFLKEPLACAFFGGRFENSLIGTVDHEVWNRDISSAYPYQIMFLPCLLHGMWEKTDRREQLADCQAALVKYRLAPFNTGIAGHGNLEAWAPFPFRDQDGSICYPKASGGGWVWKDEYLAGERLFPYVEFEEAWIYRTDCKCQPFKKIAEYYCERCRIGKEGPGIVLKLGCNSCYGKLAQSIGRGQFNNWMWAGMTTSGTRAQFLALLGQHQDWWNCMMVATDGIYTKERLGCAYGKDEKGKIVVDMKDDVAPQPVDTGSHQTGKPLGGWEGKPITKGVFVARPGIYFPLNPTIEEIKDVRGRGVGKAVVLNNWRKIIDAFESNANGSIFVDEVTRFCGAKTSISRSGKPGAYTYTRANGSNKIKVENDPPSYGQWITRRVEMTLNPRPKREQILDGNRLELRALPYDRFSRAYTKALKSQDAKEMIRTRAIIIEQPDIDFSDYQDVEI